MSKPLPTEVIALILGFLSYEDVRRYRTVSRSFNEAATLYWRTMSAKAVDLHIGAFQNSNSITIWISTTDGKIVLELRDNNLLGIYDVPTNCAFKAVVNLGHLLKQRLKVNNSYTDGEACVFVIECSREVAYVAILKIVCSSLHINEFNMYFSIERRFRELAVATIHDCACPVEKLNLCYWLLPYFPPEEDELKTSINGFQCKTLQISCSGLRKDAELTNVIKECFEFPELQIIDAPDVTIPASVALSLVKNWKIGYWKSIFINVRVIETVDWELEFDSFEPYASDAEEEIEEIESKRRKLQEIEYRFRSAVDSSTLTVVVGDGTNRMQFLMKSNCWRKYSETPMLRFKRKTFSSQRCLR